MVRMKQGNDKWPRASHGTAGGVFLFDKPRLLGYIIAIQPAPASPDGESGRRGGWPSGGMADAGDLKSPACNGRVGSNPTSATEFDVAGGAIDSVSRTLDLAGRTC